VSISKLIPIISVSVLTLNMRYLKHVIAVTRLLLVSTSKVQ